MIRWPLGYAGWAARDVLYGPGLIALAVVLGIAFITSRMPGQVGGSEGVAHLLVQFIGGFDWFLVLVASGSIVSTELKTGAYRTLFVRPVSPALYFLQRWLLGGMVVGLIVPMTALALWPVTGFLGWSWEVLVRLLLMYLLLGGVTFVLSTVLQRDWPVALMIFVLQKALYQVAKSADASWLTRGLEAVLPPFQQAEATLHAPSLAQVSGALGYGAFLVLLAMTILSRRPMGSGGRM